MSGKDRSHGILHLVCHALVVSGGLRGLSGGGGGFCKAGGERGRSTSCLASTSNILSQAKSNSLSCPPALWWIRMLLPSCLFRISWKLLSLTALESDQSSWWLKPARLISNNERAFTFIIQRAEASVDFDTTLCRHSLREGKQARVGTRRREEKVAAVLVSCVYICASPRLARLVKSRT